MEDGPPPKIPLDYSIMELRELNGVGEMDIHIITTSRQGLYSLTFVARYHVISHYQTIYPSYSNMCLILQSAQFTLSYTIRSKVRLDITHHGIQLPTAFECFESIFQLDAFEVDFFTKKNYAMSY